MVAALAARPARRKKVWAGHCPQATSTKVMPRSLGSLIKGEGDDRLEFTLNLPPIALVLVNSKIWEMNLHNSPIFISSLET